MIDKHCPLCLNNDLQKFSEDRKREYYKCSVCNLIFVPKEYHLSIDEEMNRYSLHQNSSLDLNYVKFLSRINVPLYNIINENSNVLDFGCGPGPILKYVLPNYSNNISEYDPIFKNNSSLLNLKWDLIISTEVIEHVVDIESFINKLWSMLKHNGVILFMTQLHSKEIEFKSWYYKGDQTHIAFFSRETFRFLANKIGAEIEFFDKDIIILKKY